MSHEENPHGTSLLVRVVRVVVPWIALIGVVTLIWSQYTAYRNALDERESTATVETSATAEVADGGSYVRVLSDGLNLRSEPSTTAAVVAVLNGEQRLTFIEEGTGWYHVRDAAGVEGWVAAGGRYTELVEP